MTYIQTENISVSICSNNGLFVIEFLIFCLSCRASCCSPRTHILNKSRKADGGFLTQTGFNLQKFIVSTALLILSCTAFFPTICSSVGLKLKNLNVFPPFYYWNWFNLLNPDTCLKLAFKYLQSFDNTVLSSQYFSDTHLFQALYHSYTGWNIPKYFYTHFCKFSQEYLVFLEALGEKINFWMSEQSWDVQVNWCSGRDGVEDVSTACIYRFKGKRKWSDQHRDELNVK